ncbi:hypothetical protein LR085_14185 [Xanthomonas campestris pv. campestris]|uniref:hypothetical protein n=1 Tax=Xanthomonas campestris TaxID=339 RepID=UPI0013016833|nr:hypothetical protein [Xanthomonas campestris]MEB1652875.1 hypothetical protein [Xanthomonas campestris pv. campestris]UIU01901.1 hypothetical protein LR085_14185 [Xanthomonas campestris pv. campestris]
MFKHAHSPDITAANACVNAEIPDMERPFPVSEDSRQRSGISPFRFDENRKTTYAKS